MKSKLLPFLLCNVKAQEELFPVLVRYLYNITNYGHFIVSVLTTPVEKQIIRKKGFLS